MEALVQMTGHVGGDVEVRGPGGSVASFRLACTPRVRRGGEWEDGKTTWITVSCFRSLAENVAASVRKGDPVMVVGRLRTSVFERDGQPVERLGIEATAVGHDLARGETSFRRRERTPGAEDSESEPAASPEPGPASAPGLESAVAPELAGAGAAGH